MIRINEHERRYVPSDEEFQHIENLLTSILVPIYFFNDAKKTFRIESYRTVRDLKNEIMRILTLNNQREIYYSLYEIDVKKAGTEERFIEDTEKVCGILSIWNITIDKDKKQGEDTKFRFNLKL